MKYLGPALIIGGIIMLIMLYLLHITFVSELLLTDLSIIIIGVIVHVKMQKRNSPY